jgi:uncharacterized protein
MNNDSFFGRQRELQMLQELLEKRTSSLVVVKGRRRIGKSRLIQEFCKGLRTLRFVGLPPEEKITDQNQREEFCRQLCEQTGVRGLKAEDWGDLFWNLSQHTQKGRIILVMDEINWMGSHDPTFLGKLKTAWDEKFKLNNQLILILSGSMSSWINENIICSTGFLGRVSLDMTIDELPLYECSHFWHPYEKRITPYEKFKILSVTGGVPRYLEEINPKLTAEDNIRRLCFRKESLLFNEFDRIFTDLFGKRASTYRKIVQALSLGPLTSDQILKAIDMAKGGTSSDYLHDLQLTGYISQDHSWSVLTGEELKTNRYRLKDNYLRFYLKYIEPNRTKIEQQKLLTLPAWDGVMGYQFENLVLNNRHSLYKLLSLPLEDIVYDNPFFQKEIKTRPGCQVDLLIQTRYLILYLVEIKFSVNPIDMSVVDEVLQKINRLPIDNKRFSIRPILIHVNGVTPKLKQSDFFTKIIDFGQLLEVTGLNL